MLRPYLLCHLVSLNPGLPVSVSLENKPRASLEVWGGESPG